jgi:hypothetical protein
VSFGWVTRPLLAAALTALIVGGALLTGSTIPILVGLFAVPACVAALLTRSGGWGDSYAANGAAGVLATIAVAVFASVTRDPKTLDSNLWQVTLTAAIYAGTWSALGVASLGPFAWLARRHLPHLARPRPPTRGGPIRR